MSRFESWTGVRPRQAFERDRGKSFVREPKVNVRLRKRATRFHFRSVLFKSVHANLVEFKTVPTSLGTLVTVQFIPSSSMQVSHVPVLFLKKWIQNAVDAETSHLIQAPLLGHNPTLSI